MCISAYARQRATTHAEISPPCVTRCTPNAILCTKPENLMQCPYIPRPHGTKAHHHTAHTWSQLSGVHRRPVIRTSAAQSRLPAKVTFVPRNVQEPQAHFENEFHKQHTYNGHNVPRHNRVFPWKYRRCTRDIRHTRRKKGRQSFIDLKGLGGSL